MRFTRQPFTVGLFDILRDDPESNWEHLLEMRPTLDLAVKAMLLIPELTCELKRLGYGATEDIMMRRIRYGVLVGYLIMGDEIFTYFFGEDYVTSTLTILCSYVIDGPEDEEFDAQSDVFTDVIFECALNTSPLDPVSKVEAILEELDLGDDEFDEELHANVIEMFADAGPVNVH